MFTKSNLEKLEEKGVSFVVAAKLKTLKKDFKEELLTHFEEAKTADPELAHWIREYEIDGRRLIVNYSSKRAAKDSKDRERLIERITKKLKDGKVLVSDLISNSGTKKYLKIEKKGAKEATLNTEKIEQDRRWDGLHAVITNHPLKQVSAESVLERYKGMTANRRGF